MARMASKVRPVPSQPWKAQIDVALKERMRELGRLGGAAPSAQRTRFTSESGRAAVLKRWQARVASGTKGNGQ
jgi:hypothetical protein